MRRDEAADLIKKLSLEEKLKLYEMLRRIEEARHYPSVSCADSSPDKGSLEKAG